MLETLFFNNTISWFTSILHDTYVLLHAFVQHDTYVLHYAFVLHDTYVLHYAFVLHETLFNQLIRLTNTSIKPIHRRTTMKKDLKIFYAVIAFTALGLSFSFDIFSNYFKDAYDVTALQRGFIEFPRELPGALIILVVASLSSLTDIRIGMIAQFFSLIGIAILAFITPSFNIMLVFLFINSMGMHVFLPLRDSIGLSLIDNPAEAGRRMGQYKGLYTAFQLVGLFFVVLGTRANIFSFTTPIKWAFLVSALMFAIVFVLLSLLNKHVSSTGSHQKKIKFIFRKEYKYYYALVVMFGVQKQMMMVYGPWVLIELLNKKVDTIATLSIIGGIIGVFFIPALGRLLDRYGVRKLLFADALSFILVYVAYGILSGGYYTGSIAVVGIPVLLAYGLFIVDKMSTQMGLVRTLYLRSIALEPTDITPTLSLGVSMDHVVSITSAGLGGLIWVTFGPQYIFFIAAAMSLVNLYVAFMVPADL